MGGQAGGSGGSGGAGDDPFCDGLPGTTWLSVTEQECGNAPDGGARCRWRISFTEQNYAWQHSDLAEAGLYTCAGNQVSAIRLGGSPIIAQFSSVTQTLTWENLPYTMQ
jgi:hypothetical protein